MIKKATPEEIQDMAKNCYGAKAYDWALNWVDFDEDTETFMAIYKIFYNYFDKLNTNL